MTEFIPFPKIPRLNRPITITEKLDGTNASVFIGYCFDEDTAPPPEALAVQAQADGPSLYMMAGSRNRWLSPGKGDNYGFAGWVQANSEELFKLGPGHHFGEWWGQGIQRGYGLDEKRFSLFNTNRWADDAVRPACCHVVPVMYAGSFDQYEIDLALSNLMLRGSMAAEGYGDPEGIIIYHAAAQHCFKVTIKGDESPKGQ